MKTKKVDNLIDVEIEVDLITLNKLKKMVTTGEYKSVEDAIVGILTVLTEEITNDSKKKKPKQPVGPKKIPNPSRRPSSKPPQRMPQRRGR